MSRALDHRLARAEAACEAWTLRAEIAQTLATGDYHPSLTVEAVLAEMHRLAGLSLEAWREYWRALYDTLSPDEQAEADHVQVIFRRRLANWR